MRRRWQGLPRPSRCAERRLELADFARRTAPAFSAMALTGSHTPAAVTAGLRTDCIGARCARPAGEARALTLLVVSGRSHTFAMHAASLTCPARAIDAAPTIGAPAHADADALATPRTVVGAHWTIARLAGPPAAAAADDGSQPGGKASTVA